MDVFQCAERIEFSYHSSHINLLARALNQATKICLQIESSGFINVQVMMPMAPNADVGKHSGILDFKVGIIAVTLQRLMLADAPLNHR